MANTININVSKVDLGLDQVNNTSDLNKPISTATQTALNGKVDKNSTITGATKTKITYDSKGLVTAGADATTADITEVTDKRYVTDAQLTLIGNTSGINTGNETNATIKTKLGAATSTNDGYLTSSDWSTFNSKQNALGFTPENVSNKSNDINLGNSTSLYPTQNAVKVYTDNLLGNANALVYKGVLDCSSNPNYPSANAGELYIVSVAGKIGGASGVNVEVGDMLICNTDSTASGNQATVGNYWNAIQKNIDGAVTGGASSVNNNLVVFDGTTGKVIKDSGIAINATFNYITKKDLVGNIVNSLIYDNGTNIGIGVTNPSTLFHVATINKTVATSLIATSTEHFTLSNENSNSGYNTIVASNTSLGHRGVYKSTRSRGTLDSPLAVSNGDVISSYVGAGYDGTQIVNSAGITFEVDNSVSTNNVPQSIVLATGTSTRTERMRINSTGDTIITGNVSATNLSGTNTGDETTSTIKTKLGITTLSGSNTGDETQATIKTKLGAATTSVDGYLTSTDWNTFNGKQNALGFTAENVANKSTDLTASATKYPTVNAVNTGLGLKENVITAGTTSQYYRGDKTFQTLDKTAVGLGNCDNTSDVNKPISSATQTALDNKSDKNITLDRKTASYTLVANDNGKLIEMNVASANTLTINASLFSAGNQILISQYGAGQTTITAGAGVTLRSSGGKLKTSAQYALVTIIAISSTEFYIAGDLTA